MTTSARILILTAMSVAVPLPASAQLATGSYDANGDGVLSQSEFDASFGTRDTFRGYDGNADGLLDQQEFDAGFAGRESEFRDLNQPLAAFSDFDTDANGSLDETEYNTGTFNSYDLDRSGGIEVPEASRFESDMSRGGLFDR